MFPVSEVNSNTGHPHSGRNAGAPCKMINGSFRVRRMSQKNQDFSLLRKDTSVLGWKVVSSSGKEGTLSGFTSRGRVGGRRRRRVSRHIFLIHHRVRMEPDLQLTDLMSSILLSPLARAFSSTDASLHFPLCFHVSTTRLEPICVNPKLDFIQYLYITHISLKSNTCFYKIAGKETDCAH